MNLGKVLLVPWLSNKEGKRVNFACQTCFIIPYSKRLSVKVFSRFSTIYYYLQTSATTLGTQFQYFPLLVNLTALSSYCKQPSIYLSDLTTAKFFFLPSHVSSSFLCNCSIHHNQLWFQFVLLDSDPLIFFIQGSRQKQQPF